MLCVDTLVCPQVVHGCDPNAWHRLPDGSMLTLLHRAILLLDNSSACFLVKKGADVNSSTKQIPGGGDAPPLHMAASRGLQEVVRCLVEHRADINAKVHTHTHTHTHTLTIFVHFAGL